MMIARESMELCSESTPSHILSKLAPPHPSQKIVTAEWTTDSRNGLHRDINRLLEAPDIHCLSST